MPQTFRATALVPRGFVADEVTSDGASALITVRSVQTRASFLGVERNPAEFIADIIGAWRTCRSLGVRFASGCERVGSIVGPFYAGGVCSPSASMTSLSPWARRTARLDHIVHHLRLALGGRPAASFARRLMVRVNRDALLRVIRRRGSPPFVPPTVIGIDDWAWRRNPGYGTLICDLERRRTIALLPDSEPATAREWLSQQPQIAVVARDLGGAYALATAKALPDATRVANR